MNREAENKQVVTGIAKTIGDTLPFSEAEATRLHCSIRIATEGLHLIARGAEATIYASFIPFAGEMVEELKHEFFRHEPLSFPFAGTHLYIDNGANFVLIPNDLTQGGADEAEEWLQTPGATDQQLKIPRTITVEVEDAPVTIAFPVHTELYDFTLRSFSIPHYDHPQRPLINSTLRLSRRLTPKALSLIVADRHLDVCLAHEGHLLLANRYPIAEPVDFVYFVTALWRHFGMDPHNDHLNIYTHLPAMADEASQRLAPAIIHTAINDYPNSAVDKTTIAPLALSLPPELILDRLCE